MLTNIYAIARSVGAVLSERNALDSLSYDGYTIATNVHKGRRFEDGEILHEIWHALPAPVEHCRCGLAQEPRARPGRIDLAHDLGRTSPTRGLILAYISFNPGITASGPLQESGNSRVSRVSLIGGGTVPNDKSKTQAIRDLCVQYLVCADARISHEAEGHQPVPEMKNGKDTGRIAHRVRSFAGTRTGVTLFFKGKELFCDLTSF
jgi:hypothetical protein